jgi:hypothetical protein
MVEVETMAHQEATTVVSAPLAVVEERLTDVESWPAFLVGLEGATKTAHQRYQFRLRQGRSVYDAAVAVLHHPREHRFSWRVVDGPAFDGELRLAEVDSGHTRIVLSLRSQPRSFVAGMAELFSSNDDNAVRDLQRLDATLARGDTG